MQSHKLTYEQASDKYDLPKSTILDGVKGRWKSNRLGRATTIDKEMETILVGLLIKLSDAGIGLTKCEILKLVQDYLKRIEKPGEEPLFKNGTPSDKWYRGFIERWKSILSPRMAAKRKKPRAKKEKFLSDKKNCFICKKLFEDDEIAAQCNWRGCEKCSNWYCFNCSNKIAPTDASADFLCLKCH